MYRDSYGNLIIIHGYIFIENVCCGLEIRPKVKIVSTGLLLLLSRDKSKICKILQLHNTFGGIYYTLGKVIKSMRPATQRMQSKNIISYVI